MTGFVYVLFKYRFYESDEIVMVSEDYSVVKNEFDKLVRESSNRKGYHIHRYVLDEKYDRGCNRAKILDWIIIEDDGELKEL